MNKTIRDVAKVLCDVPHSISCKVCKACDKCKIQHNELSCVDCIEEGLQKLIARATPIATSKLIDTNGEPTAPRGIVLCISCRQRVHESDAFCRCCGQALDWSKEDENT